MGKIMYGYVKSEITEDVVTLRQYSAVYCNLVDNWINSSDISYNICQNYIYNYSGRYMNLLTNKNGIIYMIDINEKNCGFCGYSLDKLFSNAELYVVLADEKYRNKGYGKVIISMMEKMLLKIYPIHRLIVSLNSDNCQAMNCYSKCGYVVCVREHDKVYKNSEYIDRIIMEKLIDRNYNSLCC